ncbi:MAG: sigma-70 family RNA polymerase sigma factor [Prevotella sp.]|nr:sigma-70 family RNA polymerase sigma factor [Prevotella sp.]
MQDREKQFKELFLSEYGRMYKAACILLGDEDEAKDVVQDVFAKLWAGTITLREETQRAFLLTCVRNRCLNIIAHHQAFRTVPTDDKAIGTEMADAKASRTTDEELVETINRYVDEKLTPQTSRIIRMHFDEERSYKEISSDLGVSQSAVNKHIVQGLRKLRSTFKNREA